MAKTPTSSVVFEEDRIYRQVTGLPAPLPAVPDDVDWQSRDFDGFRMLMLEELAARVPERRRFTPADLEVVLVEALAVVLDQLSDSVDRVTAEAYLETARRPESVRRLLDIIGYDAVEQARAEMLLTAEQGPKELDRLWLARPWLMEQARIAGPRLLRRQVRMVTVDDYREQLERHPLVRQAGAVSSWGGAWPVMRISVALREGHLQTPVSDLSKLGPFYTKEDLIPYPPPASTEPAPAAWQVLAHYVDQLRMVGQQYEFCDVRPIGVCLAFTVRVATSFFQSEVRQALQALLSSKPGGFFVQGRHRCGEDIRLGDLLQLLTGAGGVEAVVVDEFRRQGVGEKLAGARVSIGPDEYAVLGSCTLNLVCGRLG